MSFWDKFFELRETAELHASQERLRMSVERLITQRDALLKEVASLTRKNKKLEKELEAERKKP